MALTPIFDWLRPASADVTARTLHKRLSFVVIKGAFLGFGTLRVVAGIVFVVSTGSAQKFCWCRSIQGDARMTESLERGFAVRTGNRLGVYRLVTAGAIRHWFCWWWGKVVDGLISGFSERRLVRSNSPSGDWMLQNRNVGQRWCNFKFTNGFAALAVGLSRSGITEQTTGKIYG